MRQTLSSEGYEVIGIADSGEKAVFVGQQSRPDLVIMDIVLPGPMDGIAAAQRLYDLGVSVVYLTAYSDRNLIDRAQYTHPLGYIIKPAKVGELAAIVQLALFKKDRERLRERGLNRPAIADEADYQFRLMVAGLADFAVFTLDARGNVNSWNAGAEHMTGYRPADVLGQPFAILFSAEDRANQIPESELQIAREKGSADDTRWLVRRDGARYWAEGVLTAIRDSHGTVTGFTKITRDATAHKNLEEELHRKEESLRVALHAARTGTWHWDIAQNIDTIDESLCALFGLKSPADIRTIEDFFKIVHRDDRSKVEAAFDATRVRGEHLETEFRVKWPDGSEHWLLDKGEVVYRSGKPWLMTGACVDITARKQAEQALFASEARLRLFIDNVRDYALFRMDIEGRITTWNAGAENVLGYTAEDIIGQPGSRLFTPEDVAAGEAEKEIAEATRGGRSEDERWHLRKDGTRIWCSGVLNAMYDEHERLSGFAKVMRDETERRETNERLQASLREKEVLLKEIHHRVKNNLQVVTSLLTLQAHSVTDERVKQKFDQACNRVRSIADIHAMLYLSPDLANVNFAAYVALLANNLRTLYTVDADKIPVEIDADVNLAVSEAVPCGLIVNELLTNSFKYAFPAGRSGVVRISLTRERDQCVLEVSDNGVGAVAAASANAGESLGMTLVSVLTEQLRGNMRVEARNGMRVTVAFPSGNFPAGGQR